MSVFSTVMRGSAKATQPTMGWYGRFRAAEACYVNKQGWVQSSSQVLETGVSELVCDVANGGACWGASNVTGRDTYISDKEV